jgi:serine/threonine protein kinase
LDVRPVGAGTLDATARVVPSTAIGDLRPPPSDGRRKGRYVLGELLGSGGMAEVFSGCVIGSHGFQKPVAIKRLLPALANDNVFLARLIDEAKLLVGLQHGNIVSVLDLARDGDDIFLVMDFVDGPSLRQLLKARRTRRLSLGTASYIVQAAARGLEFAHARPGGAIIHSDVSPSNLLLTTSGEVRVADFGIARREGSAGRVEGKWAYMSPEQARGEPLTPNADVFALGVVLYELITGQHPYGQRTTGDVPDTGRIRIARPRSINAAIPPGLDAICMKAIAQDPRDRYVRMQHLIDALEDERFTNRWRDGASDLALVIRKVVGRGSLGSIGPHTQVTGRPLTILTDSLVSQPIPLLLPNGAEESIKDLEPPSHASHLETLDIPTRRRACKPPPDMASATASSATLIPSSYARTAIPETPLPLPPPPPVPASRIALSPSLKYELSPVRLPDSSEATSVHCGRTIANVGAIAREPATSKWAVALFGVVALLGVMATTQATCAERRRDHHGRPGPPMSTSAPVREWLPPFTSSNPLREQPRSEATLLRRTQRGQSTHATIR